MTAGFVPVAAADYHADQVGAGQPTLSKSILQLLVDHSPAHARQSHPLLNPAAQRKEEERFDIGTAAHAILLEGVDKIEPIAADDWRTKWAREARDEARAAGRVPLLVDQAQAVREMVAAARVQLEAHACRPVPFTDGKPEQCIVWDENGVACRALIDWLRDDRAAIDDYKTTSASASPAAWTRRTLWQVGAHLQVAFYLRGVEKVLGVRPDWRFVVQETYPPYALSVVDLAPSALALAEAQIDWGVAVWRRCLESGEWPAYAPRVASAEVPTWLELDWLEREAREETG